MNRSNSSLNFAAEMMRKKKKFATMRKMSIITISMSEEDSPLL